MTILDHARRPRTSIRRGRAMVLARAAAATVAGCVGSAAGCGNSGTADTHTTTGLEAGASADATLEGGSTLLGGDSSVCLPSSADQAGCSCTQGQTRGCYTGPASTRAVGACKDGSQSCRMDGEFLGFGACTGAALPGAEAGHCSDGIDNDCNGLTDCKDPACATDPACLPAPDAGPDASGPLPDAAPDGAAVGCPASVLSRTVGAHRSVLPSLVWTGGGYTIVIDDVVSEQPFVVELSFEKTDATGALIAGPTPITPNDGVSRDWPRAAFSGLEYGITYDEGGTTTFVRTDASLVPIAGSKVALGSTNGLTGSTFGTAAVAWSNQTWGVAWATTTNVQTTTLSFERFDVTGAPIGSAQVVGSNGLSDNGAPMIATSAGWAIVASGSPAVLYEIAAAGTVRGVPLPFDALRASLTSNGTEYGIVADRSDPIEGDATFVRVQIGGGVVAGSVATLGTSQASLPTVVWAGQSFVAAWSETYASDPEPLKMATIGPSSTTTAFLGSAFSAQTNAGFNQLAAGTCGWAVVYGTFTANLFDLLQVQP